MATARKTKKTAKAATPPKTVEDDFLSPKKATEKKSSKKKEKPSSNLPVTFDDDGKASGLAVMMDEWAAADLVAKASVRKAADAKDAVLKHVLKDFAQRWASEGARPESRTWKGTRSQFDHVVTSAINFSAAKQEAIKEELEIDMSDYLEVSSLKIDLKKLQENPAFYKAFKDFLGVLGKDMVEYVGREFKLSSTFFDNLANVCGKDEDRIHKMIQILQPRVTPKSIKSQDAEEDLYDIVREMEG